MLTLGVPRFCSAVSRRALRAPRSLLVGLMPGGRAAGRRAGLGQALRPPARLANTAVEAAKGTALELTGLPDLAADLEEVETAASAAITQQKRVLLAVDPDNSGAVAVAHLQADGGPLLALLHRTDVTLHDMPCLKVAVGKRQRKQADPDAVVTIVRDSIEQFAASPADMACMLEMPVPGPANGRQSVFGTGYAFGVWSGVLSAHSVPVETVSARRWKSDLGLNKCGKDGSRTLAAALFPRAEPMLRRKKDHGRAEALLILAWSLGMRLAKTSQTAALMLSLAPGSLEEPSSSEEEVAESEAEPELAGLTAASAGQEASHIIASPGISAGKASLEARAGPLVLVA